MYIGKPWNIKWALIFLTQARSLRNIRTYVHRLDNSTKEHIPSAVPKNSKQSAWTARLPATHSRKYLSAPLSFLSSIIALPSLWRCLLRLLSTPADERASRMVVWVAVGSSATPRHSASASSPRSPGLVSDDDLLKSSTRSVRFCSIS
jgi:hypothetical protein